MTTTTGSTSDTAPDSTPATDDRDPAGIVADMVDHVLALELGVRRVSLGSLLYRAALGEAMAVAANIRTGRPVGGDVPTYAQVQNLGATASMPDQR